MLYVVLCLAFFYLPILVTMIFSFNSSKSLTRFTGFSLRWYQELLGPFCLEIHRRRICQIPSGGRAGASEEACGG